MDAKRVMMGSAMRIFGMVALAGTLLVSSAAPAATWIAPPTDPVRPAPSDPLADRDAASVFGAVPMTFAPDHALPSAETPAREQSLASLAAVPEVAIWMQLIIGTGLVGFAVRQRQSRRAQWRGLVARLSGRVREA